MDDLNFNVDDIINDVNAKMKSDDKEETDAESVDTEAVADTVEVSEPVESVGDAVEEQQEIPEVIDDESEDVSEEPEEEESVEEKPEPPKPKNKGGKKKKKKRKKKGKVNNSLFGGVILVVVILTVSLVLAVGGISIGMEYYGIGKTDEDIRFNIPAGSTNSEIADILVNEGVIKNKKLFMLALKIEKPAAIYPGDITLQPSSGYSEIIENLSQMRESYKTVSITFTEGESLLEIANKLEKNEVCSAEDFLFEFNKNQGYDFENDIDDNGDMFYRMEGYFYPDTYEFYVEDSASNVTKKLREQFEKKYETVKSKIKNSGMSLNEVMTLASIVQLEAASESEMPKVASVFLNRLDDPDTYPMLQSDTTTNYINDVIKVEADNTASIEHYTECYDTYKCKGLPAGPICNPGMAAINAVLDPKKTDYYYFCNNLKTGETFYAKTLDEHEENLVKAGLAKKK
ncbi:endolytic transglycosylase MltG [uncultured Ruminococcus sp.]|uniref:endolytic transglycosylase MltG n=1 Tax=uncultured Ruminococcus sp. TaxID=165186 RepID=UPI0025D8D7B1|nr:endolytic transglycosylase MltG [uncultured Ruminococcus sp.]